VSGNAIMTLVQFAEILRKLVALAEQMRLCLAE
jgi:hypothetical protein